MIDGKPQVTSTSFSNEAGEKHLTKGGGPNDEGRKEKAGLHCQGVYGGRVDY